MSENLFFCPSCRKKNEIKNISSITINSGKIKFECNIKKHEESLEKYVRYLQNLAEERKLASSNAPLIDGPIETKMRSISDLIRAFQLFLNTHFNYSDNYMNAKSIINLGKSIDKQEKLSYNIDDGIKEVKKKEKEGKKNIKILEKKYKIFLNDDLASLRIKGKYTEDGYIRLNDGTQVLANIKNEGFNLISTILFKNLKEINLSYNGISSVKDLDEMILPYLEFLDLSNNLITDIEPVASLKSKYLKTILLQDNKIEDLLHFIDNKNKKLKFDELEILRFDNNPVVKKTKQIKELKEYGKKIILIYQPLALESFNKKYDVNLSEDETRLDLSDKKNEELLLDLFQVISFQPCLKCLYLDNNNIDNAAILSNMPLYYLETLDLSLNKLTNIVFLRKLSKKCSKLKYLYLNDNKIVDITPFKNFPDENNNISFNNLVVLNLKNNLFYTKEINNKTNKNEKEKEKEKKITIIIKDKETREIFDTIIEKYTTDFGKKDNIIIKEKEEKKECCLCLIF